MRLTEAIETKGVFWLPEQPDTQVSGVLKISESGEITVDLAGEFGNPLVTPRGLRVSTTPHREESEQDPRRIVGVLQKGGPITLDRCLWQNTNFSFPGRLSTSTVYAELAFVGAEYEEDEEALFSEFSFSVEGLETWLSVSGIETEWDTAAGRGVIRFHAPDDIPVHLPNDTEMRFSFGLTFPSVSVLRTEAAVRQTAHALVKLKEPRPLKYFSSLAFKLCNFLTLALDQAVAIQSMTGYLGRETSDGENRRMAVRVYGQFAPWPERKPTIRWPGALLRCPHVASQLEDMMGKWFESYQIFEPAFNLYFASRTQPSQFLDTKILWLTQALEALHRRSSDETEMSEKEFDSLCESVMQGCPPDRRRWSRNRLRYDNELSFRNRIRRLLGPLERWFGDERKRRAFVDRVCDTRNYLTHYDETSTGNRAGSDEMFELYGRLEALFQLHLLSLIGLNDASIDSIVEGNRGLRRRLGGPRWVPNVTETETINRGDKKTR